MQPSSRSALALAMVISWPLAASGAESEDGAGPSVPAPTRAFEIGIAGGYTQPLGQLPADLRRHGLVGPGGAIALELGYRVDPNWSISTVWQVHQSAGDPTIGATLGVLGSTSTLQCTHRFLPFAETSPFVSFGAGYRLLWLLPNGGDNVTFHGIQAAKVAAGFDLLRPREDAAVGALIGFDLTALMFDNTGGAARLLDDPRPVSFIFVALAGSFDLGGASIAPPSLPATAR